MLNSDEQHVALLRAVKVEKAFVFVTFTFILLIASLNIFFSLSMLVIDKKKDVAILQSMGAEPRTIRNIFLIEGTIVAFTGALTGLVIGVGVSWAQKEFGLVSMGTLANGVEQPYPVKMLWQDIVLTVVAIIVITITVSIRPANQAANIQIPRQHLGAAAGSVLPALRPDAPAPDDLPANPHRPGRGAGGF